MKNWKTSAESILTTGPVVPVIVVKNWNTQCRWQKRWLLVGARFWK
ncbi:2-keto-3-deoxygluconate 6-phosphate aldolase [Escherichia coli]|uniref:2-keto-3-deoxygluconate 6-phosphate aldolase n=1 Tax=Escherichia coli TaxID=562 RepID=A0A377BNZ8_ECOLX|nr:2-keto-3-deoxygluconate 6-phosphate aldolase [Escherichia coli]